MGYAVHLSTDMAASLRTQLVNDAAFLESQGVIDYSLLIGIHEGVEHGRDEWVTQNQPELQRLFALCQQAGASATGTKGKGEGGDESKGGGGGAWDLRRDNNRMRMFDQVQCV
jgi:hypothetical protein